MNTHRYVTSVERRFYAAHWLAFCDLIRVEPQKYGAFAKNGHMIGLQLPRSIFTADALIESVRSLRMFYNVTENGVEMRCYLLGARYYKFVFFEDTIAISEDDDENVRKRTSQNK